MPKTTVYAYQDPDGGSPILAWLENLRSTDTRGYESNPELHSLEREFP